MPLVVIVLLVLGIVGFSAALASLIFVGSYMWPVALFIAVEALLAMGMFWFALGTHRRPRLVRALGVVALALWVVVFMWRYL